MIYAHSAQFVSKEVVHEKVIEVRDKKKKNVFLPLLDNFQPKFFMRPTKGRKGSSAIPHSESDELILNSDRLFSTGNTPRLSPTLPGGERERRQTQVTFRVFGERRV